MKTHKHFRRVCCKPNAPRYTANVKSEELNLQFPHKTRVALLPYVYLGGGGEQLEINSKVDLMTA
jgi:hypothetical protein